MYVGIYIYTYTHTHTGTWSLPVVSTPTQSLFLPDAQNSAAGTWLLSFSTNKPLNLQCLTALRRQHTWFLSMYCCSLAQSNIFLFNRQEICKWMANVDMFSHISMDWF